MSKVLMIGLDGATWDLIKPWAREGKLPNFKKLLDEGVHGDLESTIPPFTIPAWNSLGTGKNPGKLGVYTFMSKKTGEYEFKFVPSNEDDIWKMLSANGKKVIVVNVPNVHSVCEINGVMIAGWLHLGNEKLIHPKALRRKLDEIAGGYEVDVMDVDFDKKTSIESIERDREDYIASLKREDYIERVYAVMEKRFRVVQVLLSERKWDFAFVVFVATDRIQHIFWARKKILFSLYKKLDNYLGCLLDIVDSNTLTILVSDHGFGAKKRIFNVNEWLVKEGYLTPRTRFIPKMFKAKKILYKLRLLSVMRFLVDHLLPSNLSNSIRRKAELIRVNYSDVDWSNTKVFSSPFQFTSGDLYINLMGREKNGIVSSEQYEKIRDDVIRKLRSLTDPSSGEKVSVNVYRREEIYHGPFVNEAPDLLIEVNSDIQGFDTRLGHERVFSEAEGGEHRTNGIFLAYGPDVKRGVKLDGAKIYDVAPTILHFFNLPIPTDVDGKVLKEIFHGESEPSKREVKHTLPLIGERRKGEQILQKEEEIIIERLRKLGYI